MHGLILAETLFLTASAAGGIGIGARQLHRKFLAPTDFRYKSPSVADLQFYALVLQRNFGYNPHSLPSLQPDALMWQSGGFDGAIVYRDDRRVWLASGDPLTDVCQTGSMANKFLRDAERARRAAAFVPATEKFARQAVENGFSAVKIGAAPYFDLPRWNPTGERSKQLRYAVNKARRAGVEVENLAQITDETKDEVLRLCAEWSLLHRSKTDFGWLFELAPFRFETEKRFFLARDASGKIVGMLAASPIPARGGWYLEDVLRAPDAPNGTASLLVKEALRHLRDEGFLLATLGTVPFAKEGALLEPQRGKHQLLEKSLKFVPEMLDRFYNFDGLRRFKAKFAPSFWESEYALFSNGFLAQPLVAQAVLKAILTNGVVSFAKRQLTVKGASQRF